MRLIDADELIEFINGRISDGSEDPASQYTIIRDETLMEIGSKVKSMPTVDAEPVIRCKDCKWYEFDEKLHCGLPHGVRLKDDYCSDAERRKENVID